MGRDTSLWTRRLALGARDGHGQGSIGLLSPKGTGHRRWAGPSLTTLRRGCDDIDGLAPHAALGCRLLAGAPDGGRVTDHPDNTATVLRGEPSSKCRVTPSRRRTGRSTSTSMI